MERLNVAKLVLVKGDDGKLQGLGDANRRAYARFEDHVERMEHGELVSFEWKQPRSLPFHRRFFVLLNKLFERQETFGNEDDLRAWLTIGAGHVTYLPGIDGQLCALPKSIAFDAMENNDFMEFVRKVEAFLWTEYAMATLWPHLSRRRAYDMVQQLSDEMER